MWNKLFRVYGIYCFCIAIHDITENVARRLIEHEHAKNKNEVPEYLKYYVQKQSETGRA